MKASLDQLRRELENELEDRLQFYPRLIQENRMHPHRAKRRLLRMRQLILLLNAMTVKEFEEIMRRGPSPAFPHEEEAEDKQMKIF